MQAQKITGRTTRRVETPAESQGHQLVVAIHPGHREHAGQQDDRFAHSRSKISKTLAVIDADELEDRRETLAVGGEFFEVHEQIDDDEQPRQANQAKEYALT